MKRADLDCSINYYDFLDDLDLRPSLKKRILDNLRREDMYYLHDLCKRSKDELLAVPDVTAKAADHIEKKLWQYDLRLSMTDEQLDSYYDVEYFEKKNKSTSEKVLIKVGIIMTLAMVLLMPSYFVVITVSNMLEDVRHRSIESVDQRIDEIRNGSQSDYMPLDTDEDTIKEFSRTDRYRRLMESDIFDAGKE